MLYANPLFWQYGLLAFVSGCCTFNNQHRRQNADAAKATPSEQEELSEKDVDALTFMQTVIMSFARGMEHGDQTLPINDLFVHLPVQVSPALVKAIGQQGFTKAEVKSGWGCRPRKDGIPCSSSLSINIFRALERSQNMNMLKFCLADIPRGPNLGQATAKHGIHYCLQG